MTLREEACLHDLAHVVASDGLDRGGGLRRGLATIHHVGGAGDLPTLLLHEIAHAPIAFQDLVSFAETMTYPALETEGTDQRVAEKVVAMAETDAQSDRVLGVLGMVANGDRRAGATEVEMAAGQTLAVNAEEDDMVVVPDVGPTSCTFAVASPIVVHQTKVRKWSVQALHLPNK